MLAMDVKIHLYVIDNPAEIVFGEGVLSRHKKRSHN
jgi:hypothetical protein